MARKLTTPGSMTNNKNKNSLPRGNHLKDNIKKTIVLTIKTTYKAVLVFLEISHENPWTKPATIPPNAPAITPKPGMEESSIPNFSFSNNAIASPNMTLVSSNNSQLTFSFVCCEFFVLLVDWVSM